MNYERSSNGVGVEAGAVYLRALQDPVLWADLFLRTGEEFVRRLETLLGRRRHALRVARSQKSAPGTRSR